MLALRLLLAVGVLSIPARALGQDEAATDGDAGLLAAERDWLEGSLQIPPTEVGTDWIYGDVVPARPHALQTARGLPEDDLRALPPGIPEAMRSGQTRTPLPAPASLSYDASRIRVLPFGLAHAAYAPLVSFLEFYATEGRSRAVSWQTRAGRWRAHIERIADEMGAPRELLWIAAIESSFTNTARSHAGAVGMWQFMEATGRAQGLRIDRYVDERMDPDRATRAAMTYLMDRYERFGSWPLAFAAYNAGSGHVRGELRRAHMNDFWRMDDYLCVYGDARRYALRAITLAILDANPDAFDLPPVTPDAPIVWEVVEVPAATRLSVVAEAAGTSVSVLRELNPALRLPQTPPGGASWMLRVPPGSADQVAARFDETVRELGGGHELVALQFGETVAEFAARLGTTERVVRAANDLERREEPPYGAELIVPLAGRGTPRQPDAGSAPVVLLPAAQFVYPDRQQIFYAVRAGDTARQIATHFQVPLADLLLWNDIDAVATLWSGMILQLFVPLDADLSGTRYRTASQVQALRLGSPEHEAFLAARDGNPRGSTSARRRSYTVRSGDTVGGIARRFGVSARDLVRWNDLGEDALIRIGQTLTVGR